MRHIINLWAKLIRFGFRLLYNELAWSYDLVSWVVSLGEWRRWQQAALPFVSGKIVLEIGHGPGHMLLALQNRGLAVIGLDLSAYMGRQARRRTQRTVPLVRGRVQALPFQSAQFDTVLATFPTEYIVAGETLTAVHRLLRPGGKMVIVPEGHLTGRGPLYSFIDWLFRLTGQRPANPASNPDPPWPPEATWDPFRHRFRQHDFVCTIHQEQLKRSVVTIIVAERGG